MNSVPATPSGCEASPSAADASSQSRIPNAGELLVACRAMVKATWNIDAIRNSEAMARALAAIKQAEGRA